MQAVAAGGAKPGWPLLRPASAAAASSTIHLSLQARRPEQQHHAVPRPTCRVLLPRARQLLVVVAAAAVHLDLLRKLVPLGSHAAQLVADHLRREVRWL